MLPYRRPLAGICVITSLFYIYWLLSPDFDEKIRLYHKIDEGVLNSTLGFEKIFVINLPARTDRRDAMSLAGAVSNLSFTWVSGLTGDQVPAIAVSANGAASGLRSPGARGSWRSHMNAVEAVIEQDLGSALIMEDDVDWDVRLKRQLLDFASASRTWLGEESRSRDPQQQQQQQSELRGPTSQPPALTLGNERSAGMAMSEEYGKHTIPPSENAIIRDGRKATTGSIYGEDWDVLWLGHCGTDLPGPSQRDVVSPLKVALASDETVPHPQHLRPHPFALPDKLGEAYPPRTRLVHAPRGTVCSLAYAVSRRGARKLARRFFGGEGPPPYQWDLMLRDWCQGGFAPPDDGGQRMTRGGGGGGDPPVCVTVQPPLVSHYYAGGGASDIRGQGGGYARGRGSPYIRLSVRANLRRLVAGLPEDEMVDQLPDDGEALW
ncbi:glycosyltransferase family 25 protein [Biscogniauxia marginata]|nr:glycosyltransferase family 25 protein [Biscogniauxia marginata]